MNIKTQVAGLMTAAVIATAVAPATPVMAQSRHRQETKNTWRNAAIGGGALSVLGLLTHNGTMTTLGAAGGLYSLSRYEHDRKSQSRADHERARLYERRSFTQNGHMYVRRTVTKNGHKYYQYVRR